MTSLLENDALGTLAISANGGIPSHEVDPEIASESVEPKTSSNQGSIECRESSSVGQVACSTPEFSRMPSGRELTMDGTISPPASAPVTSAGNAPAETAPAALTLADVRIAIRQRTDLGSSKRRDLLSALSRISKLFKQDLAHIPLDFPMIAERLASINPVANGISAKSLANIRSGLLSAVTLSKLKPGVLGARGKPNLSEAWKTMRAQLAGQRSLLGTKRLAHYCSGKGIEPHMVSDQVIEAFMVEVRDTSLRGKQHQLHRNTTIIWNEIVASLPDLGLTKLSVPASHRKYTRVKWDQLSQGLRQDTDAYLMWCAKEDLFVPDARKHALTPRTIENIRVFINAAATALIQRGVPVSSINGLADLVTLEAFSAILNHRYEAVGRKENQYNVGLAFALSQIAEHWVKVDSAHLTELKRRASKLPQKTVGQMTERNRRQLHQFDDPEVRDRLDGLPDRLWREVRREAKPNWHTLVQAQAAIAIGVLNNAPIRLQNLTSLEFDRHLFLREVKDAISTCEFTAEEVKNEVHLAFDLPPPIAKMLIEYRDVLVPKVLGYRPDFVFINKNGELKKEASVRQLIQTNLSRHVGIEFHPHAFRHLAGKILLDDNPGGHELVRQFLGHKRIQTTVNYYTGVDTRRAGRHFQNLLAKARLERSRPMRRERKADARGRRAAGE